MRVELKHIKELMAAMGKTGTRKLLIKKEGFELQLEHEENGKITDFDLSEENSLKAEAALRRANMPLSKASEHQASLSSAHGVDSAASAQKEDSNAIYATSPMVGTFYA